MVRASSRAHRLAWSSRPGVTDSPTFPADSRRIVSAARAAPSTGRRLARCAKPRGLRGGSTVENRGEPVSGAGRGQRELARSMKELDGEDGSCRDSDWSHLLLLALAPTRLPLGPCAPSSCPDA